MSILRRNAAIIASIVLIAMSLCGGAFAETIDQVKLLDRSAAFTFSIMSDNKGDSPASRQEFARMALWIKEADCKFVIGMGDLVKKGFRNDFLDLLKSDNWWHSHFYPCVADGENEYYGKGQDDWGAGAPILDTVDLRSRDGVTVRPNGCEYYAKVRVRSYTVHIVMPHFSDSPPDPAIAFRAESRQWMVDTLKSIKKGPRDIVVVGAHSISGSWIEVLSNNHRQVLIDKADLVLSATTHFWQKIDTKGHEWEGPLCINTGSVTYPAPGSKPGYVQVRVMDNPRWLVVEYVDCAAEKRAVQPAERCYVKEIGGPIYAADLAH
ncbi:MAG: hypothetical protein Q7T82_08735 [Armatimonadota bacterium]|nr:hypothetical protein [Armatimonadota bacterium]